MPTCLPWLWAPVPTPPPSSACPIWCISTCTKLHPLDLPLSWSLLQASSGLQVSCKASEELANKLGAVTSPLDPLCAGVCQRPQGCTFFPSRSLANPARSLQVTSGLRLPTPVSCKRSQKFARDLIRAAIPLLDPLQTGQEFTSDLRAVISPLGPLQTKPGVYR